MSSMPWNENAKSFRPRISIVIATESTSTLQPHAIAAQRATGSTILLIGLSMQPPAASVDLVAPGLADGPVPDLSALRIDLVAGLLPQRQHCRGHRRLDPVRVLGRDLDELHLELHALLAGLLADVAVDRVVVDALGELPHLVLHLLEGGRDLLLLLGGELLPVVEVHEVALDRTRNRERQEVRGDFRPLPGVARRRRRHPTVGHAALERRVDL